MKLKAYKEFIEPVTCVDGPVGEDKYLVNFIFDGAFIGTLPFKSMTDIDDKLNEMKKDIELETEKENDPDEHTIVFEISEVKSVEERLAELGKDFKI